MADKRGVNQAKLQALTTGTKKKSPFQKQMEEIEAKKKVIPSSFEELKQFNNSNMIEIFFLFMFRSFDDFILNINSNKYIGK